MARLFETDALVAWLDNELPSFGATFLYGFPKNKDNTSEDAIICCLFVVWDPLQKSGVNKQSRVEFRLIWWKNVIPANLLDLANVLITTLVSNDEDATSAQIIGGMKVNNIYEGGNGVVWPYYDQQERITLIVDFLFNYQYT
jgi:hypothetical protein